MARKPAFLGDSITAAMDWNDLLGRTDCQNFGVPGDLTADMLNRVDDVYNATIKPDICFIMGGKNDTEQGGFNANVSGHNLIDIAGILRVNGVMPIIIAPFKVGTAAGNYSTLNTRLTAIGSYLSSAATGAPANIVDYMELNTIWMAPAGVLLSSFTSDGTHLTTAGQEEWAFLIGYWLNQHGY